MCSRVPSVVSMVLEEPISAPTKPAAPAPRPSRSKTSYHLAQPPPSAHHRHSLGSQRALLVQVQQLSKASRPIPVVDVLPAYFYGSKLKKVGNCFKNGISQHDLVLVASEDYDTQNGVTDDDDSSGSQRRILGAATQVNYKAHNDDRKTTIISIGDGSQWEVNPLASGGYEFVCHGLDGSMQVAKWLPKQTQKRRSAVNGVSSPDQPEERRFHFSITDPTTRKRPIIAWMSSNSIDILDKYPRAIATPRSTPVTSPRASSMDLTSPLSRESSHDDVEYSEVSEITKLLIITTGVWVALNGRTHFSASRAGELPTSPLSTSFRPNLISRPTISSSGSVPRLDENAMRNPQRQQTMPVQPPPSTEKSQSRPRRSQSLTGPSLSRGIGSLSRSLGRRPNSTAYETNQQQQSSRPVTPENLRPASCILPKGVIPDLEMHRPHGPVHRISVSLPNSPKRGGDRNRSASMANNYNHGLSLAPENQNPSKDNKRRRGFRNMVSTIFRRST